MTREDVKKTCVTNEELAKMLPENFSGTLEIPLNGDPIKTVSEKSPENQEKTSPAAVSESDDLDALLWGGYEGGAPMIEFGQEYTVVKGAPLPEGRTHATVDGVVEAIKTVEDPELMLNVYDLGLIYRLDVLANGDVEIDMTVTAPACPVAGVMPNQVAEAVAKVPDVGVVTVKLVWEPAWSIERLGENAKYVLDMF